MLARLLSNIKLGIKHKKAYITIPNHKFIHLILEALWDEKLIVGFYLEGDLIIVLLKYDSWNVSLIKDLNYIQKPGNKKYLTITKMLKIDYKLIFFLSTSKGILSMDKAIKLGVGGQILFYVALN